MDEKILLISCVVSILMLLPIAIKGYIWWWRTIWRNLFRKGGKKDG